MFRVTMRLAALLLVLVSPCAFAQEGGAGPFSLFMTYQCAPENRVAFRRYVETEGVEQFETWKQRGVFANYLVLFSSFVNAGDFSPDLVVRLDFAKYGDVARWKEIERLQPAGLSDKAFRLCRPVSTDLADLSASGGPHAVTDRAKSVYLWIPYHLERGVGKPEFKKYFDGYVRPQADGWLADGALASWGMYLNQHNTGKPWDIILLFEYTDLEGLARRDVVKQTVRAKLGKDPAWKTLNESKQQVRQEDRVTIMDPILPRGAVTGATR